MTHPLLSRSLLLILALIWLTSLEGRAADPDSFYEQRKAELLNQRKKAQDAGDKDKVATIDDTLAQLQSFEDSEKKPIFEILADPEDNIYALLVRGALVKPQSLSPDLAKLVPAVARPAWRQKSLGTVIEKLGGKAALLRPHLTKLDGYLFPKWVISQKEVDDVIAPSDPTVSPRIGVFAFPENDQPMSGVLVLKEEESQKP
ncbi:MAG: hypothetical protein PW734_01160 [Verrucomicrobium sp.]|nr:hypothetical protein [Verrucomicrobium sp.]